MNTIPDLDQIKANIDETDPKPNYDSKERMKLDLDLMINNCKMYNGEHTDFFAAGEALGKFIDELFASKQRADA